MLRTLILEWCTSVRTDERQIYIFENPASFNPVLNILQEFKLYSTKSLALKALSTKAYHYEETEK